MATTDPRYRTARWRKLRRQCLERDGWTCTWPGCRRDLRPKGVGVADHRHEVNDGGAFWDIDNLQALCWSHHQAKTMQVRGDRQPTRQSPNA